MADEIPLVLVRGDRAAKAQKCVAPRVEYAIHDEELDKGAEDMPQGVPELPLLLGIGTSRVQERADDKGEKYSHCQSCPVEADGQVYQPAYVAARDKPVDIIPDAANEVVVCQDGAESHCQIEECSEAVAMVHYPWPWKSEPQARHANQWTLVDMW
eukprot:CAMPEP_0117680126 /NCGR_PEP_ID=MMETSP0804-20121206/18173_1 /TAXON_ID=1074897 /ORGANISM="Tetraselmis astigmatica, Strain CCMP880" /LENGTH=155 /DNA_ID=CAMNT_0005489577 /DNA_START=132 /DNA_END=596 /DNA_ORIENTATION=+